MAGFPQEARFMYMLKKVRRMVKKALTSKPITYRKKPEALQSRTKGKPTLRKAFKAPSYRGANFIKK